jgi:mono/diheme cytochrome c family protein
MKRTVESVFRLARAALQPAYENFCLHRPSAQHCQKCSSGGASQFSPAFQRWEKLELESDSRRDGPSLTRTLLGRVHRIATVRASAPMFALLVSGGFLISSFGCSRHAAPPASAPKPTVYGSAIIESSGGKQAAEVGTPLPQPVVVQVNDDQGNGVAGATVTMRGPNGVYFDPATGLTDSSGQFTTNVTLSAIAGRYQLVASTINRAGKKADLRIEEIALGYQELVGGQLNDQYCARCHNQESSPERVSNYDNLEVKPHPFTEGDTLNKMSDADLTAIISHGGPALNKSPLMPPYGYTLSKSEIQALIAYIRMVSDPPYGAPGIVYAHK